MEPKLYQTLLHQYRTGCVFCHPDPALVALARPGFGVVFDVAPLMPGHLIIHSGEHHPCAGELPADGMPALRALIGEVKAVLRAAYGAVTLYEHGRAGHCLSDGPEHRLCHHLHLHCVPGDHRVGGQLAERFPRLSVPDYGAIGELYAQYGDYLYLEQDGEEGSYFVIREEIERHLMRTLIAARLGHPERGDWRGYRDGELLTAGMRALAPWLRPEWEGSSDAGLVA